MTPRKRNSVVIIHFPDRRHAEQYVEALKRGGFKDEEISVFRPHTREKEIEKDSVAGAVTGGMVGAVAGAVATGVVPGVGPLVATGLLAGVLGGTAAGATTGGVLGALVGLGICEEKARHHERDYQAGHTLVVVQAEGRGMEALAIRASCEESSSYAGNREGEDRFNPAAKNERN